LGRGAANDGVRYDRGDVSLTKVTSPQPRRNGRLNSAQLLRLLRMTAALRQISRMNFGMSS